MADTGFCANCGTPRPADAGFCPKCGEKYVEAPQAEKQAPQKGEPRKEERIEAPKVEPRKEERIEGKKSPTLAIVLLLVGLIVGYGISFGYNPAAIELRSENDDLLAEVVQTRNDLSTLQTSFSERGTELTALQGRIAGLDGEIASLTSERTQLAQDKSDLELALDTSESEAQGLSENLQSVQTSLDEAESQLASKESQISSLDSQIDSLESQISSLDSQIDSLTSDRDALQTRFDALVRGFEFAPQARTLYSLTDEAEDWFRLEEGVHYEFEEDYGQVLIRFPDPANCADVWTAGDENAMRPVFSGGHSLLFTTCFNDSDIREGDIISFTQADGIIFHQVIEVVSNGVITKGIENETDDGLVLWRDIEGILVAIVF